MLVFGEDIRPYADLLSIAIVSTTFFACVVCAHYFTAAIRKLWQGTGLLVLDCVLCFAGSSLLIGKYSLYGAAYAMVISNLVTAVAANIYIAYIIVKMPTENTADKGEI